MLKKLQKRNLIVYCAALVIALILTGFSLREEEKSMQYDIVILGDSVVGNVMSETSIASVMEKRLGKTVFKGAFGGTSMSARDTQMWGSISNNEWCMVNLAEAICYNDWKSQKATMAYADHYKYVNSQALYYFAETMDTLMQIDFEQVEVLVIEHGTNDYNGGKPLDNPQDPYDETTFGGALRKSLKLLQEAYPDLHIVVMSPIYCELGDAQNLKCYEVSFGDGGTLDEYVQLEQEIAGEFNVEWVDAYHESGIWEDNIDEYLMDSLHLLDAGHELLGNFLAEYLE
ncbi:MAG: SGNH/GDSL hydrolase family protein [Lachnospiraceae bacterium]|nr:SGNH/GDSL hydrolase family protein [Lachnospiraceae bacterium]